MEYAYCDQKWWYLWRMMFYIYGSGVLVHTFRQAGHVSKMSIKRIAYEGDISLRLLLGLTIASMSHSFIGLIVVAAKYYSVASVIHIVGYMIQSALIITMIFLPKVI